MKRYLFFALVLAIPLGPTYSDARQGENPRLKSSQSSKHKAGKGNRGRKQHRARSNKKGSQARKRSNARKHAQARQRAENRNRRQARQRSHAKKRHHAPAQANQRSRRHKDYRTVDRHSQHYLADRGRHHYWDHNRNDYRRRARHFHDDNDAEDLIYTILGSAAAGAIGGDYNYRPGYPHRLPLNRVGRTDQDRRSSVNFLVRRFLGEADYHNAPPGYYNRHHYRRASHLRHPHYFHGNRRVVYYTSRNAIPPILLASHRLGRVDVTPYAESTYRLTDTDAPAEYRDSVPADYRDDEAFAVSYAVETDTLVSRDDILFEQGETGLADAYSYDIVVDLAEALQSDELEEEVFVIEGHASAEGSYGDNLRLSQDRAERIARDLVDMGVDPDRLIPVGYGETEAGYPGTAPEDQRALDRRVMVFTAADPGGDAGAE